MFRIDCHSYNIYQLLVGSLEGQSPPTMKLSGIWLFLHITVEITSFRLHHCQLCTIVIVLYLTPPLPLALPLAHSNSTIDDVYNLNIMLHRGEPGMLLVMFTPILKIHIHTHPSLLKLLLFGGREREVREGGERRWEKEEVGLSYQESQEVSTT